MKLIDYLKSKENIIVLSPHHDDFLWSLASLVDLVGPESFRVINIFTRSKFTTGKIGKVQEITKIRKIENIEALYSHGINDNLDLDFDEAIMRGHNLKNQFVNSKRTEDRLHIESVSKRLEKHMSRYVSTDSLIIVPLGFGSHIDHIITRDAACIISNFDKLYFEELPYVARNKKRESAESYVFNNNLSRINVNPEVINISCHIAAYNMYESQAMSRHVVEIKDYLSTNGISLWSE